MGPDTLAYIITFLGAILLLILRALQIADKWPDVADKYDITTGVLLRTIAVVFLIGLLVFAWQTNSKDGIVGKGQPEQKQQAAPLSLPEPPSTTGSIDKRRSKRTEPDQPTIFDDLWELLGHKPARR